MSRPAVHLRLRERRAADPTRGHVPADHYAIVAGGEVVGEIVLRLGDTPDLIRFAGQVGYRVEPTHRGHGHAAQALRLLLPVARAAGMDELWITCSPDNIASRRTLEKTGAVLVETVELPPASDMAARGERLKCRYRLPT